MSKKPRDNRPYIPPVKRIELSEDDTRLRLILIAVFLTIAVIAFAYGISSGLSTEPGWQVIEAAPKSPNYKDDFVLQYDFSGVNGNPTAAEKQITAVYTKAQEDSFRIFSAEVQEDGIFGLAYLNAHPNEVISVEPALYQALALVEQYDNRHVFTAPATGAYSSLFLSTSDEEAALCDPELDPDQDVWFAQLAGFVQDPEAIHLELCGENQVKLCLSDAYWNFAQEQEITVFLDFGWMRNAFVADYLADALADAGFTDGYLVSYDGFTRNLDKRGQNYSMNLYNRQGSDIYMPACLHYNVPMAIVSLRDYPMMDNDRWHYYAYKSGRIVTVFLDPADCKSGSSVDTLVSYSSELGCAEILMQTAGVFTADRFDAAPLLNAQNVSSIWFEDQTLCYTDSAAQLTLETEVVAYSKKLISQ